MAWTKEQSNAYAKRRYQEKKTDMKLYCINRYKNIISCALSMIIEQVITDPKIWHIYCNIKRSDANNRKKYPYSAEFTDDIFFEKMTDGCWYCGDYATSIDRLNSTLDHTPDNCVGCCEPCNFSKGNGDPNSFIRKAYFRTYKEYFDDDEEIWSDNTHKPRMCMAKKKSQKQGRDFTLTQDVWDALIIGKCVYCSRYRPDTKWFGVDRVIPDNGYTLDNVVSCCHDCNNDKSKWSVEIMMERNERIANRLKNGDITPLGYEKTLRNNGDNKKKICVYGKVYSSYEVASQSLGKYDSYVSTCLHRNKNIDNIFEITSEFYEFAIKNKLENITRKMYNLFNRM
jgi:hypothetical protein